MPTAATYCTRTLFPHGKLVLHLNTSCTTAVRDRVLTTDLATPSLIFQEIPISQAVQFSSFDTTTRRSRRRLFCLNIMLRDMAKEATIPPPLVCVSETHSLRQCVQHVPPALQHFLAYQRYESPFLWMKR